MQGVHYIDYSEKIAKYSQFPLASTGVEGAPHLVIPGIVLITTIMIEALLLKSIHLNTIEIYTPDIRDLVHTFSNVLSNAILPTTSLNYLS